MKVLDEASVCFQEAGIPVLAEGAIKQAYYQALAASYSVLEAVDEQLVESAPDGTRRVIRALQQGVPVLSSQRVLRLKQ